MRKGSAALLDSCQRSNLARDETAGGFSCISGYAMVRGISSTTLFEVVNYRYENMLPTVFTSQYSLDALERRLSRNNEVESAKAVVSRICEMSKVVVLKSPDRRRRKN